MIYGIRRFRLAHKPEEPFVQFALTRPVDVVTTGDVPTPTTDFKRAQTALALCPPEWAAEIVLLQLSWRRP